MATFKLSLGDNQMTAVKSQQEVYILGSKLANQGLSIDINHPELLAIINASSLPPTQLIKTFKEAYKLTLQD